MTLPTALAQSCDTYFYDVGNRFYDAASASGRTGRRCRHWAQKFGFGAADRPRHRRRGGGPRADAGLAEADVHDGDWDKAWNPGDSIQLAIGQKDMTVTPLQMARFYAMIANGGKLVTPYVVSVVEQPGERRLAARAADAFPPDAAA